MNVVDQKSGIRWLLATIIFLWRLLHQRRWWLWWCLCCWILIFPIINCSANSTIKIGFLSTFRNGSGKLIAGAMTKAITDLNRDKDILPGHRLEFIAAETGGPGSYISIKNMTMMRDQVQAFVGPDESCTCEALAASAWNIPLVSYQCIDQDLSNKTIYPTFARTLPSSSNVSKTIISLLKYFKWNKIVLIVSNYPSKKNVQESFTKLADEHGIKICKKDDLPKNYLSRSKKKIKEIIDSSYNITRIYVLLTDVFVLKDFIRLMQKKGLLESGQYAIVSVQEEGFLTSENENLRHLDLRGLLIITSSSLSPSLSSLNYSNFIEEVRKYNKLPPFEIPSHPRFKIEIPIFAWFLYDAVVVLANAFHRILEKNEDIRNGTKVIEVLKGLTYKSSRGFYARIDNNGDAEVNYSCLAFDGNQMKIFGTFHHTENGIPNLTFDRELQWYGNGPISSEPGCGFNNELQINGNKTNGIIIFVGFILVIVAFFIFKHYHYEYKLTKLLWKIYAKDMVFQSTDSEYPLQNVCNVKFRYPRMYPMSINEEENEDSDDSTSSIYKFKKQRYTIAVYKGTVVFVKRILKKSIDLTRNVQKELIQMREMRHENINLFMGAIVDSPNIAVVFVYCARGNLEDVLRNKDINLDNMFEASLVSDLIKGMIYLHDSEIISHGNLKPSNCLIDSRWVLQISDYGLHEFKANQDIFKPREALERDMLWKAPELLKDLNAPPRGTQKGDIYSFALILYEIILRKNPFEEINLSHNEILQRIINPELFGQIFRPQLTPLKCPMYISKCIEECWKEEPDERPDFRSINIKLKEMQLGLKPNIFDNMIAMLEKYSYNLESLVQERTKQLLEEKKKTENLLLRMLPKTAAEQLKRGEAVEAEYFDCVTIYFSDIVGFTELSAMSTPIQVVNLLNDLYTCFDSIIGNYDVYKVETIGDAYMVVSGLPIRNGDKHAGQIASMALHLLKEIFNFEIAHRPGEYLKLRIGIHSGPCVAGVVGLKMPRYCLFGDTVNVASRMESTGEAHKIHVSYTSKQILENLGGYILEERGLISIKGKGQMQTYWLRDRFPSDDSLAIHSNHD